MNPLFDENLDDSLEGNTCEVGRGTVIHDVESSKLLPEGYQPSDFDVICGRGKGHYNQPGNRKFRDIILARLQEYQSLKTKLDKTTFLNRIIEAVRSQNGGTAHFVRQVSHDLWERLGDEQAREKVGHAIREALAPRYKNKSQQAITEHVNQKVSSTNIKKHKRLVTPPEENSTIQHVASQETRDTMTKLIRQSTEDRVRSIFSFVDSHVFEPNPIESCTSSTFVDPETSPTTLTDVLSSFLEEPVMTNVVSDSSIATVSQNSKWAEYQLNVKKSKKVDLLSDEDDDIHDVSNEELFEPVPICGLNYSVSMTLAGLFRQISQPSFLRSASALLTPDYVAVQQFGC